MVGSQFQSETLQEILASISTPKWDNRQICCVVDGLDECNLVDRTEMLRFFKRLVEPPSRFKLICLSRPNHDIEKSLRRTHLIILQQQIERIVDAGLNSIPL